jgi:2-oxoisovalerate dehydrogenase E1 component alpha subunit
LLPVLRCRGDESTQLVLHLHCFDSSQESDRQFTAGAGYKYELDSVADPSKKRISVAYFGDGAASSVDFHSACNFASTLRVPMIFFCRNNGYAISTPVKDQYAGEIRVDGNDIFAVHAAVQAARSHALQHSRPVMIEAMTYRQGHHSTSDNSLRYRDAEEVQNAEDVSDPLLRFDLFLRQFGWMDDDVAATIEDEERIAVLRAMDGAEKRPDPDVKHMFEDVYHEQPPHLVRQEDELRGHLERWKRCKVCRFGIVVSSTTNPSGCGL